jgi:uroporphyrinogen-III synthase
VVVPLITARAPADPAPLAAAVRRLVAGEYAWLAVTSATAVRVVAGLVPSLPSGVRVAAVGQATASACAGVGWRVDVVPDDASAEDLAAAMTGATGRVLFPRSDLAAPTLTGGLRQRGLDVDDVVAYRTVGTGTGPIVLDQPPDAVLVTSGSVAREIALRMTPLDPRTRIACIGPRTAADARAAGLPVHVVGGSRSAEALLDAVVRDLESTPLDQPDHSPHHPPLHPPHHPGRQP